MTMNSLRITGSLQSLIDSRLDTIERMLMGRVPRQDCLAIVKDVETQIFDMLKECGNEEPSREDILGALARLDPPEAYLPEEGKIDEEHSVTTRRLIDRSTTAKPKRVESPRAGKTSGILGITALIISALSPVIYIIGIFGQNEIILLGLLFCFLVAIMCMNLVGLTLAIISRLRGAWSIVGVVLNSLALLFSVVASGSLTLLILGNL